MFISTVFGSILSWSVLSVSLGMHLNWTSHYLINRSLRRCSVLTILIFYIFQFLFFQYRGHARCQEESGSIDFSADGISGRRGNNVNTLLRVICFLHLANFNDRALNRVGQQASLARTNETFEVGISETCIQDAASVITLRIPDTTTFSRFSRSVSGYPVPRARDQAGAEIALIMRDERLLLYWILVNSRFCPVWLDGYLSVIHSQLKHRCLFPVSTYASTDCSYPVPKRSSAGSCLDHSNVWVRQTLISLPVT